MIGFKDISILQSANFGKKYNWWKANDVGTNTIMFSKYLNDKIGLKVKHYLLAIIYLLFDDHDDS